MHKIVKNLILFLLSGLILFTVTKAATLNSHMEIPIAMAGGAVGFAVLEYFDKVLKEKNK